MKINNAELISLLFDEPKLRKALAQSTPYLSKHGEQIILNIRCLQTSTLMILVQYRQKLVSVLQPFLGYEIYLECEQITGDDNMVAVVERSIAENNTTDLRFLSLETLARATNKSPQEVKILLGKAREVIHPMEDGSEMITESAFDSVVLQWAKSFKEEVPQSSSNTEKPASDAKPRKPSAKLLTSELTVEDIVTIKSGANAGAPSLTNKSIQQVLENFFGKVKLEDTTKVDAVSAFIEGTSEFGVSLRKKILGAYKKFTKGGNAQEIQDKLIEGAKTYLESMAATAAQE
ncbi:hypothetical protein NSTC745_06350 [Nostoc sp. DSM 114161]|jgi:hypothetical protein|uniref:hypothetical protein n=1 Tax=Nostoc sp. DSM 114161 TaxID=3440143 RepID=UPI004045D2E0